MPRLFSLHFHIFWIFELLYSLFYPSEFPSQVTDPSNHLFVHQEETEESEPEEAEEEEDVIIDLEGDIDVALLGKGGCRGGGWQEGGWPKVKGI